MSGAKLKNGDRNPALYVKGQGGRQKGATNHTTRQMKEALVVAAGLSKHSNTKDLTGYLVHLADTRQAVFASLLGRLIPEQSKLTIEARTTTHNTLNINMPLNDMISAFEQRIKAAATPRIEQSPPLTIEHEPTREDEPSNA